MFVRHGKRSQTSKIGYAVTHPSLKVNVTCCYQPLLAGMCNGALFSSVSSSVMSFRYVVVRGCKLCGLAMFHLACCSPRLYCVAFAANGKGGSS